ncbi:MAG: hypothetical protein WC421_11680 [Elusimicrobiales bacterium]
MKRIIQEFIVAFAVISLIFCIGIVLGSILVTLGIIGSFFGVLNLISVFIVMGYVCSYKWGRRGLVYLFMSLGVYFTGCYWIHIHRLEMPLWIVKSTAAYGVAILWVSWVLAIPGVIYGFHKRNIMLNRNNK